MTSTSGISDMALQMSSQGHAIATSAAPVIHFQAIAQDMESLDVKDEKEEENSMAMGQAVVSCLQTIGGVTGTVNQDMDALGIVIEEVQIMEEVEWHQEEIPVIQFRQLCRICAVETPNLIAIFGEEGSSLRIAEKIYWHLPIEVKEDDNLPLTICTSCATSLNSWHELATSSIEADEKLRKIFNITEPSLNKVTEIIPNERATKRSTIPIDQLSKAIELLKRTKEPGESEEDKTQKNCEDDCLDGTDIKLSIPPPEDSTSDTAEKSESSEFLDPSIFPSGYSRPQRQIKRKFPEGCDIFLKSKIAGAMHDIMTKDDDDKNYEVRQKRRFHHKDWKCQTCGLVFGKKSSLIIHQQRKHSSQNFSCSYCDKTFRNDMSMRVHERSHTKMIDDKTEPSSFRSRFHLSEHMNVHTGRRPYACNVCGKHFHKKIQLRQHGSAHSGIQPFKCHLCGVRFNRRGNMTQHIKRHDRERKYSCRVCNEGFATLGAVLSHRKKHTKEEVENSIKNMNTVDDPEQVAYKCEVCGKLLAKKDSLAIHMRSHTGEKPFECGRKGALDVHMRTHTGERPFACDICGRRFTQKNDMLKHRRTHSPDRPTPCPHCGQMFSHKREYAKHQLLHIATTQAQVQHVEQVVEPTTQTVLITTADNLITYPEINVPVMENTQTLILHRY
ncbi:hypothetical protein C0J52_12874 [Blattella germanica]|nr:hypothetical protein C0J52_12874 [Blattella germanica]